MSLRWVRVAIGPIKHVTARGPGCNRTETTRPFEGCGSQSDQENTSLGGARVAIGPRKHDTWRGRGRNQIEKTLHFEGTGSQSGRESPGIATPSGILRLNRPKCRGSHDFLCTLSRKRYSVRWKSQRYRDPTSKEAKVTTELRNGSGPKGCRLCKGRRRACGRNRLGGPLQ